MEKEQYQQLEQSVTPKPPYFKNAAKAFFCRGHYLYNRTSCIAFFYIIFFDFTEATAGNPTVSTMVFFAMILTGFGLYKRIGQFGGAGSAVPVTGFGNAVISAAIEHKSEGLVLGVGGNLFKLAGSVVLFGVVSAFFLWRLLNIFL